MRLAGSGEAHRRNGKAGGFGLPFFFIGAGWWSWGGAARAFGSTWAFRAGCNA